MPIKPNKPKSNRKLQILLAVFVAVLMGLGGFLWYRHDQNSKAIAVERAQYAQAEKDLDDLNNKINTEVGMPPDKKKVKECGYTSDTFELAPKGELYCNIGWQLNFSVKDIYQARELSRRIDALTNANTQSKIISMDAADEIVKSSATTPVDIGGSNYMFAGLTCFSAYSIITLDTNTPVTNANSLKLHIEMNCASKRPLAEHYAVKTP